MNKKHAQSDGRRERERECVSDGTFLAAVIYNSTLNCQWHPFLVIQCAHPICMSGDILQGPGRQIWLGVYAQGAIIEMLLYSTK